ncbi:ECF transporter S component [Bacillus sp. MUM 13]|uniref:ECF transporter S component n=1 Tax=Bacillus sp. MUM 13 TaxID=1678001 RepID=UPI0008F5F587|nr:ECF transporter S component [Bacillus sp. MUM 13]OIK13600.1 riboflavin transporter FmnP [Bacillus sp. MUM 13]
MKESKVKKMVTVAMLGSLAYLLMLLNFPFPGLPPYLKIDFSDLPALVAALIFGPLAGILVEFIKNLLDFVVIGSPTGVPVGHIANFVAGVVFVLPAYYIYKKASSKKGMTLGLAGGAVSMAILMSLLNYFVFLPAYTMFMGWAAMSGEQTRQLVTTAILPFNMIKGVLMGIVFMLLFTRLHPWINKQARYKNA